MTHPTYKFISDGSVGTPRMIATFAATNEADAIERAKAMSKELVSQKVYRFALWTAPEGESPALVAHWQVELVPTITCWRQ